MKMGTVFVLGAGLLLMVLPAASGQTSKYVAKPDEEIYGAWTNADAFPPKQVHNPDGTVEDYASFSDRSPFRAATEQIFDKWTDSEGNVWYKTVDTFTSGSMAGAKSRNLWKVSKSGTILEMEWAEYTEDFPSKIDPKTNMYFIFHKASN